MPFSLSFFELSILLYMYLYSFRGQSKSNDFGNTRIHLNPIYIFKGDVFNITIRRRGIKYFGNICNNLVTQEGFYRLENYNEKQLTKVFKFCCILPVDYMILCIYQIRTI